MRHAVVALPVEAGSAAPISMNVYECGMKTGITRGLASGRVGSVTGPGRKPTSELVAEALRDDGHPRSRLRVRLTHQGVWQTETG